MRSERSPPKKKKSKQKNEKNRRGGVESWISVELKDYNNKKQQ